jgi:hypothetical protein
MRRPAMVTTAIVYSREEAKKPEDNSEEEMEGQFRVTSCGRRASNNQHPPFMNVCSMRVRERKLCVRAGPEQTCTDR